MKKTYRITVLLIIVATILSANDCGYYPEDETHHTTIYLVNWGDKPIFIFGDIKWNWDDDSYIDHLAKYNYNILDYLKNYHFAYDFGKIMPGKTDYDLMDLERTYYESLKDKDSVAISVYDGERVEANDSDNFIVCYLLSSEDLKKLHFQVSYPPTEDMKDVYMYPTYEEVLRQSMHNDSIQ